MAAGTATGGGGGLAAATLGTGATGGGAGGVCGRDLIGGVCGLDLGERGFVGVVFDFGGCEDEGFGA